MPLVGTKHVSPDDFSESLDLPDEGIVFTRPGILKREVLNWHWQCSCALIHASVCCRPLGPRSTFVTDIVHTHRSPDTYTERSSMLA